MHAYSIWMSIKERRSEPRTEAGAKIVMTPLAAVATRLHGIVVNVSPRGVRVRFATLLNVHPKAREVYRIQSGNDVMLCEVRYCEFAGEGADVGLEILHWVKAGELNQLLKNYPGRTEGLGLENRQADPPPATQESLPRKTSSPSFFRRVRVQNL